MDKPPKLYQRIKNHLQDGIAAGRWGPGARIPSEFELMETFGASRMTVHRALRELSAVGLLVRAQGVGSFVAEAAPRSALLELHDIAEDILLRGHAHTAILLRLEAVAADAGLAREFSLPPGSKLFCSEIVHRENGVPVQLEERFVAPDFAPDFLRQNFSAQTPSRYLQAIAPAEEVEHVLHAVSPDARVRELLEIGGEEPCLRLARRTWVGGRPVTRAVLTHPGSRYSLGSRYRPRDWAPRPG